MPRKKTNKEFLVEVSERYKEGEWKVLGEYVGAKDYIDVRHTPCGREYKKRPDNILKGIRCEECYYEERRDKFLTFFEKEVSGEYKLHGEYVNFHTPIPITHKVCGYKYKVKPGNFMTGTRCPKCSKNIPLTDEEFKNRVKEAGGGEYVFLEPYVRSSIKLPMLHKKCGTVTTLSPNTFFSGSRCFNCYMSIGEEKIKSTLDYLGVKYEREKRIGGRGVDSLRFDYYLPEHRAAIEYDGAQHYKSVEHWGGEENRRKIIHRDMVKNHYCHYTSIKLLRIPRWLENNTEKMVVDFLKELNERRR